MDKRVSTILFAVMAVFFMAACGDGKKKGDGKQSVATTEESKGDTTV